MAYDPRRHRFANNAWGTLTTAIGSGDTSLVITATTWPAIVPGEIFKVSLYNPTSGAREIVNCTGVSGYTLTVERGREGTTALAFPLGAMVQHCITAETLEWFESQV